MPSRGPGGGHLQAESAPPAMMVEVKADGTFVMWEGYYGTPGTDVETSGTYTLEGTTFTGSSVEFGDFSVGITNVSDDHWILSGTPAAGAAAAGTWYRRGTEPGGWVFDQAPAPLSAGVWVEGDVESQGMDLYRFTAAEPGSGTCALRVLNAQAACW